MSANNSVLPIELSTGFSLDPAEARKIGSSLADEYMSDDPFPHIAIDNFLPSDMADKLLEHFPVEVNSQDKVYNKGYGGLHKRGISPYNCDEYLRNAFSFFNSAPILQFLEGITGIERLLPDPYFAGGGLHEISSGGLLGVHADFRVNEGLQLLRRVNILIYLNHDWLDEYNGKLELWDREMQAKVKSVSPIFNRCVIFNTDDDSYHGHPDPLTTPDGITRKSIALYYYTAEVMKNDSGESRHTRYVARPDDTSQTKKEVKNLDRKRAKRASKASRKNKKSILNKIFSLIKGVVNNKSV